MSFIPASDPYNPCVLCPRNCGADRRSGKGFCGEGAELRIAAVSVHRGEEPPITGQGGSGTVFFTGCTLGCVFCQNRQISRPDRNVPSLGRAVDDEEFAEICLALQERGVENINLVTGSHAGPAIARGLRKARERGLTLPILWNSSAYEGPLALAPLEDLIDVYLPDLKTLDSGIAERFFKAPGYPEAAEKAILRMTELRGVPRWKNGVLVSGVIIRHLVLPGYLDSTRTVLRWFAEHCRDKALLSLMTQYTPVGEAPSAPARYVEEGEYREVLGWLEEFGIEDGFYQELVRDDSWLPDFNRSNPFSSELSEAVWHWSKE
jgi:putative pyruvate formate lyase activating enzyme